MDAILATIKEADETGWRSRFWSDMGPVPVCFRLPERREAFVWGHTFPTKQDGVVGVCDPMVAAGDSEAWCDARLPLYLVADSTPCIFGWDAEDPAEARKNLILAETGSLKA